MGLKITKTGIISHVNERHKIASSALTKLKRLSSCPEKIKLRLCKTLIRPILEYPPIHLNTISKSSWYKLQGVQNKAILWVKGIRWPNPRPLVRELHQTYDLEPINIRIYRMAEKKWNRLEYTEDENYTKLVEIHNNTEGEHRWWPRSLLRTREPPPDPIYSRTNS